jgi:FtsH-binding integral membrane protein
MAYSPNLRGFTAARAGVPSAVLDAGLRAYMLRVYNWMASGLVLTGIVAYGIANVPAVLEAFYPLRETAAGLRHVPGPLAYVSMFAPLAFVLVLSFGVNRLSTRTVQALYWAFCVAMGASLTNIFFVYTGTSITRVFFISAGTFAAMSLWGYSTKSDLSRFGSFLIMGLFGVILASVVNIFIGSAGLQFVVSVVGVLVFVGLTAYDTQRIKADYIQYSYAEGSELAARRSVYDALQLFLNFINLFMLLLQLTGNRNSN